MKLNWSAWQTIATGIYEGNPQLSFKTVGGRRVLSCVVQDSMGNLWEVDEQAPNQWGGVMKLGGSGTVAHAPIAQYRPPTVVTGKDNQLWKYEKGSIWARTGGNGRLRSEVVQAGNMADSRFYAGIGMEQDVWWAQTTEPTLANWSWTALGKPEGTIPVNDRPAVTITQDGPQILVRGENGRLYSRKYQNGNVWHAWQTVTDNVRSHPVAVTNRDQKHVECYYFRQDDGALSWALWNGSQWSLPNGGRLGGKLQGIPAVAASSIANRTYVFARGTESGGRTKLWYTIRNDTHWSDWQADNESVITSSPAVIAVNHVGNERLVCVALNLDRALVQRTCTSL